MIGIQHIILYHMYIYIHREREGHMLMNFYAYICLYIHVYMSTPTVAFAKQNSDPIVLAQCNHARIHLQSIHCVLGHGPRNWRHEGEKE